MRKPWILVRAIGRGMHLALLLIAAGLSYPLTAPRNATFRWRSRWLHRWCARTVRAFNVNILVSGNPATTGIVAANHLSYLDILVLAAISPQVFLAKSEVRKWPVIGKYAEWAGTQFIDRNRRADVARQNTEFKSIVENDAVQTIFLEGTSSGGASVLPFKSSLLEPVVTNGWAVTPAAIVYTCEGGETARDVCWWQNMKFTPHALNLLTLDRITAHVSFGKPVEPGDDRKALAALLHGEVSALKDSIDRALFSGAGS